MDRVRSLLTATAAAVRRGDLVLDPCCGSGALLSGAAAFGAMTCGSDVDTGGVCACAVQSTAAATAATGGGATGGGATGGAGVGARVPLNTHARLTAGVDCVVTAGTRRTRKT